jgi:hypothetical protein
MSEQRYFARSASDRTEEWPFWFVADRQKGGLNVTAEVVRAHVDPDHYGGVLCPKETAIALAKIANGETPTPTRAGS